MSETRSRGIRGVALALGLALATAGAGRAQPAPEENLPRARQLVAELVAAQPRLGYLEHPDFALMRQHLVDYVALGNPPPDGPPVQSVEDLNARLEDGFPVRDRWRNKVHRVLAAPYTNARVVQAVEYVEFELQHFLRELSRFERVGVRPVEVLAIGSLPQGRFGATSDLDLVVHVDEARVPPELADEWVEFRERWDHFGRRRSTHDGGIGVIWNREPTASRDHSIALSEATRARIVAGEAWPVRERFLAELRARQASAGGAATPVDGEALARTFRTVEARGNAGLLGRLERQAPAAIEALRASEQRLARVLAADPLAGDAILQRVAEIRGNDPTLRITPAMLEETVVLIEEHLGLEPWRQDMSRRVARLRQLGAAYARAFLRNLRRNPRLRPVAANLAATFSTVYLYTVIQLMAEQPDLRGEPLYRRAAELAFSQEALLAMGVGTGVGILGTVPVSQALSGLTGAGLAALRVVLASSSGGILGVLAAEGALNAWEVHEDEEQARQARERALALLESERGQRMRELSERYLERRGLAVILEAFRPERLDLVMILATGVAAGLGGALGIVNPFLGAAAAMAAAGATHATLRRLRDARFDPVAKQAEYSRLVAGRLRLDPPPRPIGGAAAYFAALEARGPPELEVHAAWIGRATQEIHGGVELLLDDARAGLAGLQTGMTGLTSRLLEVQERDPDVAPGGVLREAVDTANRQLRGLGGARRPGSRRTPLELRPAGVDLDEALQVVWAHYWKATLALEAAMELRGRGRLRLLAMETLAAVYLPEDFPELLELEGQRVDEELAHMLWALETNREHMLRGIPVHQLRELASQAAPAPEPAPAAVPSDPALGGGGLFGLGVMP